MRNFFYLSVATFVVLSMASCKSNESAYKKAYDKAKQQQVVTQAPVQQPVTTQQPSTVAPVTTVTTTPVAATETARKEDLTLVSGTGLKAYSVVVGSFGVKSNAENLQKTLNAAGYAAQIATNAQGMYRVIASTFDDMNSAVQSRNTLRSQYSDAWLLRK